MKLNILVIASLTVMFFLLGYYIAKIQLFPSYKAFEEPNSSVTSCTMSNQLCAEFKVINTNEYLPFYLGHLIIKNTNNKSFAEIKNIYISIADDNLKPSQLVWKKNDLLDVYLKDDKSKSISKFLFKNIGDVKVIIHSPLNKVN